MNRLDFSKHTFVVTGATGHLGKAFCRATAGLNARLILIDQHLEPLRKFQDELNRINEHQNQIFCVDFANRSERSICINQVIASGIAIDGLINNAAYTGKTEIKGWSTYFEDQQTDVFSEALEVNLTSAFEFSQKLYPILRKSKNGNILNVASIYAHLGPDYSLYEGSDMHNPAAYGASKAGLVQLTRWLSTTLAPSVRVNCISPGGIYRQQKPGFVDRYIAKTPLGRMADESDIVDPMLFLCSSMARYITGQTVIVDGGYSCS